MSDDDDSVECRAYCETVSTVPVTVSSVQHDDVVLAYGLDELRRDLIAHLSDPSDARLARKSGTGHVRLHRYSHYKKVLYFRIDVLSTPRVVFPLDNELRSRLIREYYEVSTGGHFGREKTIRTCAGGFARRCKRMRSASA